MQLRIDIKWLCLAFVLAFGLFLPGPQVAEASRLREVGTAARTQIEKLLGTKVYLDLRVKIAKNWQRDPKQLGRLGF